MDVLFPYEKVRDIQSELLEQVDKAVNKKSNLIAHAPTGLGKTAAVLAPSLKYALDNDKVVFFLTSRHTQHLIAMDTLKAIKERHESVFNAVDVIGKKWLCLQSNVTNLSSGEFAEYCRKMREDDLCDFYTNLKKGDKLSQNAKRVLMKLKSKSPQVTEDIIASSSAEQVCPYEISMLLSKDSHVIVTDYFYIFNDKIRDSFLKRTGKELEDCIVIVDEAHNLPGRVKDLSTRRVSNILVQRAVLEAKKHEQFKIAEWLEGIDKIFGFYGERIQGEKYIPREDFWDRVSEVGGYDNMVEEFQYIGGKIREEEKRSYIAIVGDFLESWKGEDEGFARIFSVRYGSRGPIFILSYRCLDPSLVTKKVIERSHSTILMSGTLSPTSMYKELLGVENDQESVYPDPFPKENRLNIIIPRTSTKYSERSEEQYKDIAEILSKSISAIPGNVTVFFPSYDLKSKIRQHVKCDKKIVEEKQGMTKSEKRDFIEDFKKNHEEGSVMLGVISGSFGEGIDLPGNYLNGVIIVGLPFQRPDLETKALIDYYDVKFGKGWDYGYVFPAFNKALQSAGRCIRSEKDKGVILFLDERYSRDNYKKCFPSDWDVKTTLEYEKEIKKFFGQAM